MSCCHNIFSSVTHIIKWCHCRFEGAVTYMSGVIVVLTVLSHILCGAIMVLKALSYACHGVVAMSTVLSRR